MPVEVRLVEHSYPDSNLIKNALLEFSPDVRSRLRRTTKRQLLFDPGFKPQLVIADITASMDAGAELLKRSEAKGVPVVASALRPREAAEVLRLGARECVPKPIEWKEFRDAVVGILHVGRSVRRSDAHTVATRR